MYFVLYALDRPDAGDTRPRTRESHLAYLKDHAAMVKISGPMTTRDGSKMIGSMLVLEAETIEAVEAFAAKDPYALAGLFERVDIRPFVWVAGKPGS